MLKEIPFAPKAIGDLLDIIHNAIIVIDASQCIIFANSRTAKMFSTSEDELHGLHISQLFMPDDVEIMLTNILSITRKDREFEGEVMLRRPDGSSFLGLIAATFFYWDDKKEGMAFTIHDITAMKSIERSLRQAERDAFLGRFIDDISHQIRNPLTVIGGFARRLNSDNKENKKAKTILTEAGRLESLLDTLNKFIRLPRPQPTRIKMSSLLDSIEKHLEKKVLDSGCRWTCNFQEGIHDKSLLVDLELLLEALERVVINACESYDTASTEKIITLEVSVIDDPTLPYEIKVIDQGVGIAQENLQHIFSHFYSNKTKHVGMGLTFARRIIEEQMGHITIDSSPAQGTCVTCRLIGERRRALRTTLLQ